MRWLIKRLSFAAALPPACLFEALFTGSASAHVKWFCAYDVAGQPDGLEKVLCPDFELLTGMSILAPLTGCILEGTPIGMAMLHVLDRSMALVRNNLEMIFRAAVAFFFIAIWGAGGI